MAHFISEKCIGCTMCTRSCPVGAISGKLKERQVIKAEACIDCNACGIVCNNGAVIDENGNVCKAVPINERLIPHIDTDKCCGCELCIENCVKDALGLSKPNFKGDTKIISVLSKANACTGCGQCMRVCPQKAITMVRRNS